MNEIEKQAVEEMAKDIGIAFQLSGTTRFGAVAEILVEQGYRNCKDKVVLDKEELNMLIGNIEKSSEIKAEELEKVRQETAREILKAIKNHRNKIEEKLKDSFWEVSGTDLMEESLCGVIDEYGFFDILDDIAKEYGVEVE